MKKSMVSVMTAASIMGMLLVGCSSNAGLGNGPPSDPSKSSLGNLVPNNTVLAIDTPKPRQTFQAGESIPVSGSIHRSSKVSNISVLLFQTPGSSTADLAKGVLIAKTTIPVNADGTFKGIFHVPKPPFQGSGGGGFIMKFDVTDQSVGENILQTVYLSIPTAKPGQ
ncbi:hypothetical protein LSG31_19635 [Fodinisporobacter ferrooxydans]|uniref:Lipoprotein n=1 Tax=Fodinisporobacter ferrooxydans TaxID=2901836 RepID=A0ABY4CLC4_9BACL|nr:hypothetical protein LSG31_19635 [Alicyclobacillaceae bacterium MYW30-H2]